MRYNVWFVDPSGKINNVSNLRKYIIELLVLKWPGKPPLKLGIGE